MRDVDLDQQTRCAHYHSQADIVAIKMKCCDVFYACKDCHIALAGHAIQVWPRNAGDERVVLCGACRAQLTICEYIDGDSRCPRCGAAFNPACRNHFYFAV